MVASLKYINSILLGMTELFDNRTKNLKEIESEEYYDTVKITKSINDKNDNDLKKLCCE